MMLRQACRNSAGPQWVVAIIATGSTMGNDHHFFNSAHGRDDTTEVNEGTAIESQQRIRTLPPGWYQHQTDPSREQFWNGTMWTDLVRNAPVLSEFLGPIEPLILAVLEHHERRQRERQTQAAESVRRSFFDPAS